MENLHTVAVPSGPTTAAAVNGDRLKSSFVELQAKKDSIENELRALSSVLDSHGVTMVTPLLTDDGFPRADIDVAQIRITRSRIIHLRNDYKELMNQIEKHLHEHFASITETTSTPASASSSANPAGTNGTTPSAMLRDYVPGRLDDPFAKVNSVIDNSPAAQAGLKSGDEIRNFGYVNKENNDGLKKVAECVRGNEGQNIMVKLSRPTGDGQRQELRLMVKPRNDWGGRELLGCHILPL